MKHVIVIGNGFDLNLGLKTSYQDFIKSDFFKQHNDRNNALFSHLSKKHDIEKWVDIEKELGVFSSATKTEYSVFSKEYKILCLSFMDYISALDFDSLDKNSAAYKLIKENYKEDVFVVNFNYTPTIQNILAMEGIELRDDSLHHIHGSVSEQDIIFGVNDSTAIYGKHAFLRKSSSSRFGKIHLEYFLVNAEKISFFGHSLGSTDHMYFNHFFHESSYLNRGKTLNFYHYGKIALEELYEQLYILSDTNVAGLKLQNKLNTIDVSC